MVTICWKAQGLAFSWGAAARFMPALAALAHDLALTPTPSAPATARCTARGHGLALCPFHMHIALPGLRHVKCDADGALKRTVLFSAAKEFSAISASGDRQSAIKSTLLCYQRVNSIISAQTPICWRRASSPITYAHLLSRAKLPSATVVHLLRSRG